MKKHKTAKEMEILIAKLNKGQIKWDDIDKELELMRKQSANSEKTKSKAKEL